MINDRSCDENKWRKTEAAAKKMDDEHERPDRKESESTKCLAIITKHEFNYK